MATLGAHDEIRCLNTLRGLAALIVVVSHFTNESGLWDNRLGGGAGQIGVMLFFLLSGFLMTYLYWQREPTARNIGEFAVARFARVVPLYFLVVVISSMTPFLYRIDGVAAISSHLLFLHGESVLWTIPAEIQFYAIFAIVWALSSRCPKGTALVILLVLTISFVIPVAEVKVHGLLVSSWLVRALPFFALGGVLGWAYSRRERFTAVRSSWFALSPALVLVIYPNVFVELFGFKHAMWRSPIVIGTLFLVFYAVVFLVRDGNRVLENPIGDFFGRISYSLYLLHYPTLWAMEKAGWVTPSALSLTLFAAVATCASWVSYRVIEAPSRRAIRRALGAGRSRDRVIEAS